ncbi:MAG: MFS transporter [Chloroflexi bacterium]|nr:MFS transporter [Chloroflexota bacterium]
MRAERGVEAPRSELWTYGWVIVAIAFLTTAIGYSVRYAFPVFYVAMAAELGWGQTATVGAFSLNWAAFAFSAPFFGAVVDRFNPRVFIPLAALGLATCLLAASQVTQLWQLYVVYTLAGVAMCALGWVPHAVIITRWFARHRATAIGIFGSNIGGSYLLVVVTQYITLGYGWRYAYAALALLLILVVTPVAALFHRTGPADRKESGSPAPRPDREPATPAARATPRQGASPSDPTVEAALHNAGFWLIAGCYAANAAQQYTIVAYQLPYLIQRGYDPLLATYAFSTSGFALVGGFVVGGAVSNWLGRGQTFSVGVGIGLSGVAALYGTGELALASLLFAAPVLYSFGQGMLAPQQSAVAADLFQGTRFGVIFGLFNLSAGLAGAALPWLGGVAIDQTGSYVPLLAVVAGFLVVAAVCLRGADARARRHVAALEGRATA